jgi:hypothetical protein
VVDFSAFHQGFETPLQKFNFTEPLWVHLTHPGRHGDPNSSVEPPGTSRTSRYCDEEGWSFSFVIVNLSLSLSPSPSSLQTGKKTRSIHVSHASSIHPFKFTQGPKIPPFLPPFFKYKSRQKTKIYLLANTRGYPLPRAKLDHTQKQQK